LEIYAARLALVLVSLAAWQFLPKISALRNTSHLFDPYFVSSPTRVASRLWDLLTGSNESVLVWGYVWPTVYASLIGTALGLLVGAAMGLVLSNSVRMSAIFRPFVVAANAAPRIALVPIIVLLFGPTLKASVIVAFLVVVFVAFFNAYEGGITVPPHLIQNAMLLGASNGQILRRIRLPFVLAWTISTLPLAVTFAIISVVTGEILTGIHGMGYLLQQATTTADASLTFSVVIVLAVIGLLIVAIADAVRGRVLHWWGKA
jgi:NitT/TauT family transport system permease protein